MCVSYVLGGGCDSMSHACVLHSLVATLLATNYSFQAKKFWTAPQGKVTLYLEYKKWVISYLNPSKLSKSTSAARRLNTNNFAMQLTDILR